MLAGPLFLGALLLFSALLSLPFSVHETFVVEERFGFNRTSPRTFVLDRVKAFVLAVALGGPLLAAVLAIFAQAGRSAWLACWVAVAGYTLVVQFIAPTWIMPLFNTFTPLGAGELRERIVSAVVARDSRMMCFWIVGFHVGFHQRGGLIRNVKPRSFSRSA